MHVGTEFIEKPLLEKKATKAKARGEITGNMCKFTKSCIAANLSCYFQNICVNMLQTEQSFKLIINGLLSFYLIVTPNLKHYVSVKLCILFHQYLTVMEKLSHRYFL